MGVMATFNPFVRQKNKEEEKMMKLKPTEIVLTSEKFRILEDEVLGDFDNQREEYNKKQKDVINQSQELVDTIKKDEQLMTKKINDLKNEGKLLDKQQGEVAKALIDAEVNGDSELVEKLDAQLVELGGKQVSLQAKIRAYTHRIQPLANIKNRKQLASLVGLYKETVFNTSEFNSTLENLNDLITQLKSFKEKLETKIRLKPNHNRHDALSIINRAIGLDYLVASEKTKQLIAQEKRVISKDITYFLEEWLKCNREIGFDDFTVEEIERLKEWKKQCEEEESQRKYKEKRAREDSNAAVMAKVDSQFGTHKF